MDWVIITIGIALLPSAIFVGTRGLDDNGKVVNWWWVILGILIMVMTIPIVLYVALTTES